ncbi:hypothetical protein LPMP_281230 [Leishmania panamensis]|uniref:Uncharacterized protein n=1 Tax=Leishmania panamensis TaxID=5679 RepID=A0A088SDE2_LEIPA|nr:hypothetical protein LPMP_281230 [Leishmania panamensis]AIN99756.1 hypothetical protein LPMP_281230 [Leishmania panamensis]
MFTFRPSPARHSQSWRESCKPEKYGATAAASTALAEAFPLMLREDNVRQPTWAMEMRRNSQFSGGGAVDDGHSVVSPKTTKSFSESRASSHAARHTENFKRATPEFEDWLAVGKVQQGELTTAQQTDLSWWFHDERLAAKTPFAAVVPCPARMSMEKAQQAVAAVIDAFAFPTFYVQTLPVGATLSDVAQAFVKRPAHLPEERRYRNAEKTGVYAYTAVPCRGGRDAMKLVMQSSALKDALREVPCLLLNDYRPLTPLCLRCLVVAGRCVAAEVACDEAYAPLFGLYPNNTGAAGTGDTNHASDAHMTAGRRCGASVAACHHRLTTLTGEDGEGTVQRTASDVVAYGLQSYVEEVLGQSLGNRAYTAVLSAEVKGFDPHVLRPRVSDPPFWPLMGREPLQLRRPPFEENSLQFFILSLEPADPGPFEAFGPEELHAISHYVLERAKAGAFLPPVVRFLDGHEVERAAARLPCSPTPLSVRRSPVAEASEKEGNGKSRHHSSVTLPKPANVASEISGASSRGTSATDISSSAGPQRTQSHRDGEAGPEPLNAPSHRPPPRMITSLSSTALVTESLMVATERVASIPRSVDSRRAAQRHFDSNNVQAPTSSFALQDGDSTHEDAYATATYQSYTSDALRSISGSSRVSCTGSGRLPPRVSSFDRSTSAAAAAPVTGTEAMPRLPARHEGYSVSAPSSRVDVLSNHVLTPSLACHRESSVVGAPRSEKTLVSPIRTTMVVGRTDGESTSAASSCSSHLPERCFSTAANSLSDRCQSNVARCGSDTQRATDLLSLRPSLPPRRQLSVIGAASATAAAAATSVHTSSISDNTSSENCVVASSAKSSRNPMVVSSHRSTTAKETIVAAAPGTEQTTTAEDPVLPSRLSAEDMPMVASRSLPSRMASFSAFSMTQSMNSSNPKSRSSAPPSTATKSSSSLSPAFLVGESCRRPRSRNSNTNNFPVASSRPEDISMVQPPVEPCPSPEKATSTEEVAAAERIASAAQESSPTLAPASWITQEGSPSGPRDQDSVEASTPGSRMAQSSSSVPEPLQYSADDCTGNVEHESNQHTDDRDDKGEKGQPSEEAFEVGERAFMCFSSILPSASLCRARGSVVRSRPRETSTMLPSSRHSVVRGAESDKYSSSMQNDKQEDDKRRTSYTSSRFQNKAAAEEADKASHRSSIPPSRSATSYHDLGVGLEVPEEELAVTEGTHWAEEARDTVEAEAATSCGGDNDSPSQHGAKKGAVSAVYEEEDGYEDVTPGDEAATAELQAVGSEEQPARSRHNLTAFNQCKAPSCFSSFEKSENTIVHDDGEEAGSAYHYHYTRHTDGCSEQQVMNSADLESRISTALSAASTQTTGRRQWVSRPASEANRRPPSNAPSWGPSTDIAGAQHESSDIESESTSSLMLPVPPCKVATTGTVEEKSARASAASNSSRCSVFATSSAAYSFATAQAPSTTDLWLSQSFTRFSVDSGHDGAPASVQSLQQHTSRMV